MTTTSTFSGMNEDSKPSSRVLKPPGGGSSNIFGTEPAGTAKPRANPPGAGKPQDAGIFGQSASDSSVKNHQRSARDGDDSFNRLFGDNASSPALSQKGTSASQRVNTHDNLFGDSRSSHKPSTPTEPSNTHEHIFGDPTAAQGEGATTDVSNTGSYNPITGADYKDLAPNHHALHVKEPPKPQKEQPPLPCSDDKFQAREGKMQNVQTSTRVTNPPGGKTHKLW